jgi:hypothetical protein
VASDRERSLWAGLRGREGRVDCPTGHEGLSDKGLYSGVGVLIVLSGAALIVVGYFQHAGVLNVLKREARRPGWPLTITAAAVAGSLLLSTLIVVST